MKPRFLIILIILLLVVSVPAAAQRTSVNSTKASGLTAAEIAQVHAAFQASLRTTMTRDALRAAIIQQLRTTKPIAFVNGQWVVPIDVARLYNTPSIQAVIVAELRGSAVSNRLGQIATLGMADRLGLAFVPNQFGNQFIGISVGSLRTSLAQAAFLQNTTDLVGGVTVEGVRAGMTGAVVVFNSTMGMLAGIADAFTNWWTGGGPKDPNTGMQMDDPNADPDGDGVPNRLDGDDDGDGTPDKDDQAPYDPGTQICFDCMNRASSAAFTNTAAAGVLQHAFTAHALANKLATANKVMSLGTAARVAGQPVGIQVGFGNN